MSGGRGVEHREALGPLPSGRECRRHARHCFRARHADRRRERLHAVVARGDELVDAGGVEGVVRVDAPAGEALDVPQGADELGEWAHPSSVIVGTSLTAVVGLRVGHSVALSIRTFSIAMTTMWTTCKTRRVISARSAKDQCRGAGRGLGLRESVVDIGTALLPDYSQRVSIVGVQGTHIAAVRLCEARWTEHLASMATERFASPQPVCAHGNVADGQSLVFHQVM